MRALNRSNTAVAVAVGMALVGAPAPGAAQVTSADLVAIARARADSARLPYTDADVFFMQGMIGHHAQAVVISGWAPTHGAGESLRVLAARIINAQFDDIALMQRWLRDRSQTVPDAVPAPMKMKMGGMVHEMMMPGMLSDAQMKQLDAARGIEFDRLYLRFMVQHHEGAVLMVRDLFATDGAGQDEIVFKFASDVNVDQTTEITRMQRMRVDAEFGPRLP